MMFHNRMKSSTHQADSEDETNKTSLMLKCTNSRSYFCPHVLTSVWPKYLCQYENMCQISVHHHTRDIYISQSEAQRLGMDQSEAGKLVSVSESRMHQAHLIPHSLPDIIKTQRPGQKRRGNPLLWKNRNISYWTNLPNWHRHVYTQFILGTHLLPRDKSGNFLRDGQLSGKRKRKKCIQAVTFIIYCEL